ncbi:MAG: hypothetical protein QOE01_3046 [Actinomycetota bacterium]|jgi:hypothetical protein|nr:hypothetical protein [Actinomycetota bacterium]
MSTPNQPGTHHETAPQQTGYETTPQQAGYGAPQPNGYGAPPATTARRGRGFTIAGIVCGALALIFVPIVLGPLGIIFGFVGNSQGDRPLGKYVGIGSVVTMVLGFVIGALVLNSMKG